MATVVLLFFAGPLNEATGNNLVFPVVMAAVVAALDDHSDLMRMAIASPGVDFRLAPWRRRQPSCPPTSART